MPTAIPIDPSLVDETYARQHAWDTAPDPEVPAYVPSPTGVAVSYAMINGTLEEMRLIIVMGPRGEGKTTMGLFSCLALAEELRRTGRAHLLPVRIAVVRDTWVNLNRTTIASFEENMRRGLEVEWRDGKKEALVEYDGQPLCHFFFFGLDNRDDADKLQGFQCAILWLEEVAPAAELASGIPPEALGIGGTSLRQVGIPKRILVTMNPPHRDHWIMKVEDTLTNLDLDDINVKRFIIEAGEKSAWFRELADNPLYRVEGIGSDTWRQAAAEFDAYRRTNEALLESIGRSDLVARLVKGEVGGVIVGEAVVPEFSHLAHLTNDWAEVNPITGLDIIRCWDAGLTPSTVWYQVIPTGDINILGSRISENRGMAEHILNAVIPWQRRLGIMPPQPGAYNRKAVRGFVFRDIGDSALGKGNEATRAEETAAATIENMLQTTLEFGPPSWPARRAALKTAFFRPGNNPNRRFIKIFAPECSCDGPRGRSVLVESLGGMAHYVTQPNGRVVDTVESVKKASGIYFQELDALGHGLSVTHPAEEWLRRATQIKPPRPKIGRRRHWAGF